MQKNTVTGKNERQQVFPTIILQHTDILLYFVVAFMQKVILYIEA